MDEDDGNPALTTKAGDRMWIWGAESSTELEQQISNRLTDLFPEHDHHWLLVYSFHCHLGGENEIVGPCIDMDVAKVFLLKVEQDARVGFPVPTVAHRTFPTSGTSIQVNFDQREFGGQYLIVLARPFHATQKPQSPFKALAMPLGFVSNYFGQGVHRKPIYSGFFSCSHRKFVNGSLETRAVESGENSALPFTALSQEKLDFSKFPEKKQHALRIAGIAFSQESALGRLILYYAALEQLFGKRCKDKVLQFYASQPQCKHYAKDSVGKLKNLRDSSVHNAGQEGLSAIEERAIQCVIADGVNFEWNDPLGGSALVYLHSMVTVDE